MIQRIYIDNGSSVNIIYERCLWCLPEKIKNYVIPPTLSVLGFTGKTVWLMGKILLSFTLEYYTRNKLKTILMEFLIMNTSSPYNRLLGKTGLWQLQAVPSTVHGLLKFPSDECIIMVKSILLDLPKKKSISTPRCYTIKCWIKGEKIVGRNQGNNSQRKAQRTDNQSR